MQAVASLLAAVGCLIIAIAFCITTPRWLVLLGLFSLIIGVGFWATYSVADEMIKQIIQHVLAYRRETKEKRDNKPGE
jgi:ABC-type nickel/cobalt efflux system permease component RcnA